MSYQAGAALQAAVYGQLTGSEDLAALVGSAIFDTPPSGPLPALYVVLGGDEMRDASDYTGAGAWHELVISVVAPAGTGFSAAKAAAAAVCEALAGELPDLAQGQLLWMQFLRASARQSDRGAGRRIDLRFRARLDPG